MCRVIGMGQMTRELLVLNPAGPIRKRRRRIISRLRHHHGKVDGCAIQTRRCAGFEPAHLEPQVAHTIREVLGGRLPGSSCRKMIQADMDKTLKECTRC